MILLLLVLGVPEFQAQLVRHPTVLAILEEANHQRVRRGYQPLEVSGMLCEDAQEHANWMAATGSFQHSGGKHPEIIARGQRSAKEVIQDWIGSPGHRAILFSGSKAGFGYRYAGGQRFWVGVIR